VEGFATPKVRAFVEKFVRGSTFLLAVDESTTIKNPKAKRTKALVALGKAASFRRILTGSPVTKSPMDLYAQCGFMDKVLLGFESYYSFQGRYAITELNGWAVTVFNRSWDTEILMSLVPSWRVFVSSHQG
jgi:hypothetical protein